MKSINQKENEVPFTGYEIYLSDGRKLRYPYEYENMVFGEEENVIRKAMTIPSSGKFASPATLGGICYEYSGNGDAAKKPLALWGAGDVFASRLDDEVDFLHHDAYFEILPYATVQEVITSNPWKFCRLLDKMGDCSELLEQEIANQWNLYNFIEADWFAAHRNELLNEGNFCDPTLISKVPKGILNRFIYSNMPWDYFSSHAETDFLNESPVPLTKRQPPADGTELIIRMDLKHPDFWSVEKNRRAESLDDIRSFAFSHGFQVSEMPYASPKAPFEEIFFSSGVLLANQKNEEFHHVLCDAINRFEHGDYGDSYSYTEGEHPIEGTECGIYETPFYKADGRSENLWLLHGYDKESPTCTCLDVCFQFER